MKTKERSEMERQLINEPSSQQQMAQGIINPFASSYYQDSLSSYNTEKNKVATAHPVGEKQVFKGYQSADTIQPATSSENLTVIPPSNLQLISGVGSVAFTNSAVDPKEALSLVEAAYVNVSHKEKTATDAMIDEVKPGPDLLRRRMDALSKKIDEALQKETQDYELIHAMVLRFCMIHMRHVVKDDQEYIAKIAERIKVQSATIRDTYNTWPVVALTISSSAVSIVGGMAGFSHLMIPGNAIAQTMATNAQQISTMSTGISGCSSLLNSRNEGDRQVLQLFLKREQDKEEEKKGGKHGTKESQKLFRTSLEEFYRSIRETISSVLRS